MTDAVAVPRTFWVVAVVLLLWALVGDSMYLKDVTQDLVLLREKDAYRAGIYAAMPQWVWAAFAVGVWLGTAGSVALLLRRRIAVAFYATSLLAIIVQFGYSLGMTDMLAVKGAAETLPLPVMIFAVGAFSLWFARRSAVKGYLR